MYRHHPSSTLFPYPPLSRSVHLHRAEANTPTLRELYATADIFVLPTQAECFGIASMVAMPKHSAWVGRTKRSEEHTSELQSRLHLVCRLLLEKKKPTTATQI